MKGSLGPAPEQLISCFSLDPTWLIHPRKLPRCSRNGNHFSISGCISLPSASDGTIACGPRQTAPNYGSRAMVTRVVWAFTCVPITSATEPLSAGKDRSCLNMASTEQKAHWGKLYVYTGSICLSWDDLLTRDYFSISQFQ